jgi:histidine triad (HIT) family protein
VTKCLFCDLATGVTAPVDGLIYADDLVVASHASPDADDKPEYLGYVYAQTRRHARSLAELSDEEARAMGLLLTRLSRAIKVCAGAEHVYAEFYAEVVPHVHILVVARYAGTPTEYWRWRVTEWPQAPRGGRKEIAELARRLREHIAQETEATARLSASPTS